MDFYSALFVIVVLAGIQFDNALGFGDGNWMGKYYQILLIDGWIEVVIQDFADLRLVGIPSEVNAPSKGNL